jgi:hypothetical protein
MPMYPEVPPTNSKATGYINYEVNVKDIENVTTAQIQQEKKGENGPVVVTHIRFKAITPTGPVNGLRRGVNDS